MVGYLGSLVAARVTFFCHNCCFYYYYYYCYYYLCLFLVLLITASRVIVVDFTIFAVLFYIFHGVRRNNGSLKTVISAAFLLVDYCLSHLVIECKVHWALAVCVPGVHVSHSTLHETDGDVNVAVRNGNMQRSVAAKGVGASLVHINYIRILDKALDHVQVAILSCIEERTSSIVRSLFLVGPLLQ